MAQADLTTPADAGGTNVISCQPMSSIHGAGTTAKGWNYLRRILAGITSV